MAISAPELSGKREQNKARNRSEILAAARAVFADIGYDAATVRDIVARTDLAPGTFYNYFTDKHSVLVELIREAGEEGARRVREARARATNLEDFVYSGFRAYFEFIGKNDRTMFELMRRNGSTLRSLGLDGSGFTLGLDQLRADVEAGMASGFLPNGLQLDYAVSAIGAMAFEIGAVMVASDPPDVEAATRFASEFTLGAIERMARGEGQLAQAAASGSAAAKAKSKNAPKTQAPRKRPKTGK
jgi:AcrR family transcriptional regulator